MRVSCQTVGPKEGFHVGEHAEQAVLAEESPDDLTVADRIVEDVPKVVFEAEQGLLQVLGHLVVEHGLSVGLCVPRGIVACLTSQSVHDIIGRGQTAGKGHRLDLEAILDHHIQLLNVCVLSFSPLVQFRAEADQFSQRLFEDLIVVDLDEESQLGGATHGGNFKLSHEEFFLAAHFYQQIFHLFVDDFFLRLDAVESVLLLVVLGYLHGERRVDIVLRLHELIDFLLVQVQEMQKLARQKALPPPVFGAS